MGEPDAGNLHVRFDEEGGNPALTLLVKKKIFSRYTYIPIELTKTAYPSKL